MRDAEITLFWRLVGILAIAAVLIGWASALDNPPLTSMDADYPAIGGDQ